MLSREENLASVTGLVAVPCLLFCIYVALLSRVYIFSCLVGNQQFNLGKKKLSGVLLTDGHGTTISQKGQSQPFLVLFFCD